jgi:hypothetical protein
MGGLARARVGTLARFSLRACFVAAAFGAVAAHARDDETIDPVKPVLCTPEVEEVDVCGRTETITEGCENPAVTPAMHEEAAKHDELKDEFVRENTCVGFGPDCTARDTQTGDATLDTDLAKFQTLPDMPTKIRFHMTVTDQNILQTRDDMGLVVHKGFRRDPLTQVMLFRIRDDKLFNENAEGVALVQKAMADKERAELIKQAAVLEEMRAKFEAAKDQESADNTNQFKNVAVTRALALEAISCELDRMAQINRRTENNMKQIAGDRITAGIGQGSPGAPSQNTPSDVTGTGAPQPAAAPTTKSHEILPPTLNMGKDSIPLGPSLQHGEGRTNATGASRPPGFVDNESELKRFGPDPAKIAEAARASAEAVGGPASADDNLFVRVRRQYRVREATGVFHQSLLD